MSPISYYAVSFPGRNHVNSTITPRYKACVRYYVTSRAAPTTYPGHALEDAGSQQVGPASLRRRRGQQRQYHVQQGRDAERPLGGEELGQPAPQHLGDQIAVEVGAK